MFVTYNAARNPVGVLLFCIHVLNYFIVEHRSHVGCHHQHRSMRLYAFAGNEIVEEAK